MKVFGTTESLNNAACYVVTMVTFWCGRHDTVLERFHSLGDAMSYVQTRERTDLAHEIYRCKMGWVETVKDLPRYEIRPEQENPLYATLKLKAEGVMGEIVNN